MAMYCPRCAGPAVEGQRFCRNCGMNLDLILNAMEGKQPGPLDFERLKRDLRDLGSNLRIGFEQASSSVKSTGKLQPPPAAPFVQPLVTADWKRELNKAVNKVRAANTRKYSLQQATLSLFGGGAWMAVWYQLLNKAAESGLLRNIELNILRETGNVVTGLEAVLLLLPLLGLMPIARGVAHLINGIFFAPKQEKDEPPAFVQPVAAQPFVTPQSYIAPTQPPTNAPSAATTTNDLEQRLDAQSPTSVTEDETMRFGVHKQSQL